MNTLAKLVMFGCCFAMTSAVAFGQADPTISLDIVDVDGSPPTGGRLMTEAAPGDVITVEIRLRDWSPTGQGLRGYQAAIAYDGYISGSSGNVFPLEFDTTTDVNGYCTGSTGVIGDTNWYGAYIQPEHAEYIFSGISGGFPSVASNTCNYWYSSALAQPIGPVAPQDGTSYYLGTLILEVSADASGSFVLGFDLTDVYPPVGPDNIFLTSNDDEFIEPLIYETPTIVVPFGACCVETPTTSCTVTNEGACTGTWTEGATCPAPDVCPCTLDAECDDGSDCTLNECDNHACVTTLLYDDATECCNPVGGATTVIDDGEECTTDTCDPVTGIVSNTPVEVGTACGSSESSECDLADTCNALGECDDNIQVLGTPCGDPTDNDCTDPDTCDGAGACQVNNEPTGSDCDDGSFCNEGETCTDGVCGGGSAMDCSDEYDCTTDACNDVIDECTNTLDGGFCLIDGVCYGEDELNPENDCVACKPTTSTSEWTFLDAGTPCDDGNACTGTGAAGIGIDECDGAGACFGALDPDCNDHCTEAVEAVVGANYGNNENSGPDYIEASCQANSNHDIWFYYTAQCNGEITMNSVDSLLVPSNDPVISVYDACDGTEVICDDDSGTDLHASVKFVSTVGVTYYIRVAGFEDNIGDIVLNIRPVDDCLIGDTCYGEGDVNPENECEACIPVVSSTTWSVRPKGTICGDPTLNDCDNPDACNSFGECESNHKPDGTGCTDDGNDCRDDYCEDGACIHPPLIEGTACGDPADSECDHPDSCDGEGLCLDNYEPVGTACGDPLDTECNPADTCDESGVCQDNIQPIGTPCGDPTDTDCTDPDTCDGAGECLINDETNGTVCDDLDPCTGGEACTDGVCVGTPVPETPLVTMLGCKALEVVPQPAGADAPVALIVTSPEWPCMFKYVGADGKLTDTMFEQSIADWGTVIVIGQDIVPSTEYEVHATCGSYTTGSAFATTARWGDVCGQSFTQPPNGAVNTTDILYQLEAFSILGGQTALNGMYPGDIHPCVPNGVINLSDILAVLDAFSFDPYPCPDPCQP